MTTTWTFRTLASLVLALAVGVPAAAADYTYTYNEADQLVQAGQVANLNPVSFTYDGDGVRVKRSVESLLPTTETIYVYDAFGNVIAEYDKTGQLLADYVWVNGQRVCKIAAGEQRTYYHTGPGGSTLALTNDAAQVIGRTDYYPFGSTFASSGTQDRYAFMGKDRDFGLYYFGSRFYDPATATFSSPDPVAGSVERPQGLHRYSYALNNPNKYHDPNGEILDTILDIGFIAYEVYRIVADNVVGQKGDFKENLLALGADVGGACIPFATGGGVALRVAAHTDDVIDGVRLAERGVDAVRAPRGGTCVVKDAQGEVMRTGRSKDLARRAGEHRRNPATKDFEFEVDRQTDVYAEQRGREQVIHDQHKPPLDKIRPISPQNPRRQEYLDAAKRLSED